jgi:hypothetical protein
MSEVPLCKPGHAAADETGTQKPSRMQPVTNDGRPLGARSLQSYLAQKKTLTPLVPP